MPLCRRMAALFISRKYISRLRLFRRSYVQNFMAICQLQSLIDYVLYIRRKSEWNNGRQGHRQVERVQIRRSAAVKLFSGRMI